MRVVHASTSAVHGGAGRAARRLHEAMLQAGVDSHMVTGDQPEDLAEAGLTAAHGVPAGLAFHGRIERARTFAAARARGRVFTSGLHGAPAVRRQIKDLAPDVVNLHWIGAGFLGLSDLSSIPSSLVWTMCDMWPITGGCHYSGDCGRYRGECGVCPLLGERSNRDLSYRVWQAKSHAYTLQSELVLVAKSSWMMAAAEQSSLATGHRVVRIPNGIDTDFWGPQDQYEARRQLGLPGSGVTLAFVADSVFDPRKGFDLAVRVAQSVAGVAGPTTVLAVGGGDPIAVATLVDGSRRVEIKSLGQIREPELLRSVYCASDATLLTSREENLANVALESLACGTPVAAFDIGGNLDLVQTGVTGCLIPPFDTQEMAHATTALIGEESVRNRARSYTVENFSWANVVSEYLQVYRSLSTG